MSNTGCSTSSRSKLPVPRASRGRSARCVGTAPSAWSAHYKTSPTANETRPACFSAKNGYAWRSPPPDLGIWDWDVPRTVSIGRMASRRCRTVPWFVCRHLPCVYRSDFIIGSRFHSDPHRTPACATIVHHHPALRGGLMARYIWLAWMGRIYRNADGAATRVLGIIHDTKAHQRLRRETPAPYVAG